MAIVAFLLPNKVSHQKVCSTETTVSIEHLCQFFEAFEKSLKKQFWFPQSRPLSPCQPAPRPFGQFTSLIPQNDS